MPDYKSVFSAASQLPISERLRLVDELSASVPDDCPPSLSDEWLDEVERRSLEIDAGSVNTEPWSEVRERIMRKADVDRTRG